MSHFLKQSMMMKSSDVSNIHYSNNNAVGLNPQWLFGDDSTDAAIWHSSNTSPDISASSSGRFISGKVYNAVWNDIAECVPSDGSVANNELAMVDVKHESFRVVKYDGVNTEKIIGINSPDPGYIVGYNNEYQNPICIALKGMVWVNIPSDSSFKVGDTLCIYKDKFFVKRSLFSSFNIKRLTTYRVLGIIIIADCENGKVKIFI